LRCKEVRNDYVGRVDPTDERWKASPWTDLLKHRYYISSLYCKKKMVLDSCCGTGWGTVEYIVPFARFTVGFDLFKSATETYKQFDNYCFGVMDAINFGLKDNNFDVVLALDSIEHLAEEDGIKYLAEINRVCKKDGLVIGTTPLVIDNCLIPKYLELNEYHLCMYTRRRLKKVLRKIFSSIAIYEIYNKVSPYFLFICGNAVAGFTGKTQRKMKKFFQENKREFREVRFFNYLLWTKMLINQRKYLKASYLLFLACIMKIGLLYHEY
jgi:ubiquinone/menaquinone biosynthesis C-methylase UbiE